MTCKTIQPLIVEYADGVLDLGRRAQVQTHLDECAACARQAREMAATQALLRALPPQRTSAQFEARLAERLAQARRPEPRSSWAERLAARLPMPTRALRPALALCAAAAAVIGVILYPSQTPIVSPPAPVATESALVSQCVAQHQSDVAAQPLSDPAAQNLTTHLGDAASTASPDDLAESNL